MRQENRNADVVLGTDIAQKYRAHGYLTLTVICYKDSGGGAIWKAGDQDHIH
jgi:hypothetical protein